MILGRPRAGRQTGIPVGRPRSSTVPPPPAGAEIVLEVAWGDVLREIGEASVKLIVAIIQPAKLRAVHEALESVEVERMTVCDAQGYRRMREPAERYRGQQYQKDLFQRIALEIVVNDDFVERALDAISHVARTGPEGTVGDGRIFVISAERAIQISDGSQGPGAV